MQAEDRAMSGEGLSFRESISALAPVKRRSCFLSNSPAPRTGADTLRIVSSLATQADRWEKIWTRYLARARFLGAVVGTLGRIPAGMRTPDETAALGGAVQKSEWWESTRRHAFSTPGAQRPSRRTARNNTIALAVVFLMEHDLSLNAASSLAAIVFQELAPNLPRRATNPGAIRKAAEPYLRALRSK